MDKAEKIQLKEHNEILMKEAKELPSGVRLAVVAIEENGAEAMVFDNRMDAAKYIVSDILKYDGDDPRQKAMRVYGNLYHGLKNAWAVYGYYWKLVNRHQANAPKSMASSNQPVSEIDNLLLELRKHSPKSANVSS